MAREVRFRFRRLPAVFSFPQCARSTDGKTPDLRVSALNTSPLGARDLGRRMREVDVPAVDGEAVVAVVGVVDGPVLLRENGDAQRGVVGAERAGPGVFEA